MARIRRIKLASSSGSVDYTPPYTAGEGITIDSETNTISVDSSTLPTLTAGEGIRIDQDGRICIDTEYAESTVWIVG